MDEFSRNAFTPGVKATILRNLKLEASELIDLGGFESFIFQRAANNSIVRMTHVSHRSEEQIQAELEFVLHLAEAGAAVCKPIPFDDHTLVRIVGEFLICQFEKAPGHPADYEDWDDGLFLRWGRCIGQFHAHANMLVNPRYRRINWNQDENINFRARIPAEQKSILEYADENLASLAQLPQDADNFGLIHSDAHGGNFFAKGNKLTFFDFDDCVYQWFVFDVATILLGTVIRPAVAATRQAQEAAAIQFLPPFFEGYNQVFRVNTFMLAHMPLFLKTRELSLYAVILHHMVLDNIEGDFAKQFMLGRQARLTGNEPFLDMDFDKLFG